MSPLPVVEDLEVIEQFGARCRPRGPRRVVDELDLQRREETLSHGIVPAIAPAAHAAHDPVLGQDAPQRRNRVRERSYRAPPSPPPPPLSRQYDAVYQPGSLRFPYP